MSALDYKSINETIFGRTKNLMTQHSAHARAMMLFNPLLLMGYGQYGGIWILWRDFSGRIMREN